MRSSFIYGYGFPCNYEPKVFVDFLKNHKDSFRETPKEERILQAIEKADETDLSKLFEGYQASDNGCEGMGAAICNIISRETGIRFSYCPADDNCETPESIVFAAGYPWDLNDEERALTEDKLFVILKRYMDELRIPDDPDYLELEYFC